MKTIGGATLAGVLLALLVIYWLSPLNSGAVALVLLLCVSLANVIAGFIAALRKRPDEAGEKKPKNGSHSHGARLLVLCLLAAAALGSCCSHRRPQTPSAPRSAEPSPIPPTAAEGPPPPPPPPPPPRPDMATMARPAERIPARSFLLRGQSPPAGYGAYGYVLFTARPTAATRSRYLAICEEYQGSLQPTTEFTDVRPSQLMVTFWPLRTTPPQQDCAAFVDNYDFGRATQMAGAIRKLNVRGPILVAWKQPFDFNAARPAEDALVVDMSDFASDDDISEAFRIWRDRISQNPDAWSQGFSLAVVRLAMRSFLNTYGEQVVAIITGGH